MNKLNEFVLNCIIFSYTYMANIEHLFSNVTFFIKQFGFCFPSHLLHC